MAATCTALPRSSLVAALLAILLGAVTGYALSFWRPKGAGVIFAVLVVAAFIPNKVSIYSLVCGLSQVGL